MIKADDALPRDSPNHPSLTVPAMSVELYRYRGAAKDGGTLEYVFEAGEQNSPNAVTKEKAAEIAADFMTTFYHVQVGALETQEFRTTPVPFWLICFSDTIKGPLRQLFFVVLPPDGTVVVPRVAERQSTCWRSRRAICPDSILDFAISPSCVSTILCRKQQKYTFSIELWAKNFYAANAFLTSDCEARLPTSGTKMTDLATIAYRESAPP